MSADIRKGNEESVMDDMKSRVIRAKNEECIETITFDDMDTKEPEMRHMPRYEINITFKKGVGEDEKEKFLDKWFPERDHYIHDIEIFVI